MEASATPRWVIGKGMRWTIWSVFLVAWTTALLTYQPVALADAILPEEASFFSFKLLHIAAYAVLAILSGWLHVRPGRRALLIYFLCFHGMATELLQGLVPERTPSAQDVGFDLMGVVIGVLLTWSWWNSPNG